MVAKTSHNGFATQKSPYASVLNTNHVPSATELAELQAHLLGPQQSLSELDSEISRLQALLSERSLERDRVKSYIDAHRALMSPIRQLPAETLAEIFVSCLQKERYPVRSLDEAPLLLTTICRSWRDIAITTPRLWKSLHIYIPSQLPTEAFARRQQGIKLWLSRSGSLPLSLSLNIDCVDCFNSPRQPRSAENCAAFLRLMMSFSHRFAELALDLCSRELSVLESLSTDGFPALRSLFVHRGMGDFPRPDASDDHYLFASGVPKMPALQRLGIVNFAEIQYTASAFKWENLTELVIGSEFSNSLGPVSLCTILQQTTRLESCHFGVELKGDVAAISLHNINLPRLHTLSIMLREYTGVSSANEAGNVVSRVFDMLSCPSLQTLSVTLTSNLGVCVTKPPFASGFPSLKRLRLQVAMSSEVLTECLSLASNLLVLELVDVGYHTHNDLPNSPPVYHSILKNHHLEALASSDVDGSLCPRLKVFRFWARMFGFIEFSYLELLGFLQSKQRGTHKLELCDVLLSPDLDSSDKRPSDEVLQEFRSLQEDGLELRIRKSHPDYQRPRIEDRPTSGLDRLASFSEIIPPLYHLEDRSHGAFDVSTVIEQVVF